MGLFNLALTLLLTIITGILVASCKPYDDSQGHQDVGHVYVRVSSPEEAQNILANIRASQATTEAYGTPRDCSRRNEELYKKLQKWCVFDDEKYLVFT